MPVFKRLQLLFVLFAWFLATGAQWDVVQTIGWGRMIANYSRSMPLLDAVKMTFTAENMCRVCEVVSEAKQQENEAQTLGGSVKTKLVLIFQPVPSLVLPIPASPEWPVLQMQPENAPRLAPPTPPPQFV